MCLTEINVGAMTAQQLLQHISNQKEMIPTFAFVDAKAVFDSLTAEVVKTPHDKHLLLHALAMREFLESTRLTGIYWIDTIDMLPDGLTKGSVLRQPLIDLSEHCHWSLNGDKPLMWCAHGAVSAAEA